MCTIKHLPQKQTCVPREMSVHQIIVVCALLTIISVFNFFVTGPLQLNQQNQVLSLNFIKTRITRMNKNTTSPKNKTQLQAMTACKENRSNIRLDTFNCVNKTTGAMPSSDSRSFGPTICRLPYQKFECATTGHLWWLPANYDADVSLLIVIHISLTPISPCSSGLSRNVSETIRFANKESERHVRASGVIPYIHCDRAHRADRV